MEKASNKLFDLNLVKNLKSQHETIICNQTGRAGTSIGANIHEAQYAHGKADFVSKLQAPLLAFPVSAAPRGTLCLTFDDQHFANWAKADAIFKKYDAHATFFVCGQLDRKAIRYIKFLQNAGHSVGLHGLHHNRAVDYLQQHGAGAYSANEIMTQLEVCRQNGIKIRAFAYPYSQNSAETDQELFKIFDFLRTSTAGIRKKDAPLAEVDVFFVKNPGKKQLFYSSPASGSFDMDDVKAALKRAADENAVIVFYAHNITPAICESHHIATSQLSEILAFAKSLGMAIRGLNEL